MYIFSINIIILPMLNYFQLLYDYFSLIYSINGYLLLFYKWLFVTILLMVIDGYSIDGCWCLLMVIILMAIGVNPL